MYSLPVSLYVLQFYNYQPEVCIVAYCVGDMFLNALSLKVNTLHGWWLPIPAVSDCSEVDSNHVITTLIMT